MTDSVLGGVGGLVMGLLRRPSNLSELVMVLARVVARDLLRGDFL